MITAIKNRITYYGYAYARERANARVTPFVEAEKTAKEDEKILETPKTIELNSKQELLKLAKKLISEDLFKLREMAKDKIKEEMEIEDEKMKGKYWVK